MTVFDSLLNHDFRHYRRQRTSDGQGGWTIEPVLQPATIRGRIRPASSEEREVAAQEQRQISHVFYCRPEAGVKRGDRVEVGNLLVDVDAIREPSKAGHHLECDCLERQKEEAA